MCDNGWQRIGIADESCTKVILPLLGKTKGERFTMKIIDNPALGISLLICVGVAVFGIAMMTTADEQFYAHPSVMFTSDDDSPFLERQPSVADAPRAIPAARARTGARPPETQQAAQVPEEATSELPRVPENRGIELNTAKATDNSWIENDPFAPAPERQPVAVRQNDNRWQVLALQGTFAQPRDAQRQSGAMRAAEPRVETATPSIAEKRDELLFRIVELRLQRGEFESIAPVVMQMQNPEKAIEAMLDFAEDSEDEDITQLLDVATQVTLQMGQPRPPMPPGAVTSGVMPGLATALGATPSNTAISGTLVPPGTAPQGAMSFGVGSFAPGPGQAMPLQTFAPANGTTSYAPAQGGAIYAPRQPSALGSNHL